MLRNRLICTKALLAVIALSLSVGLHAQRTDRPSKEIPSFRGVPQISTMSLQKPIQLVLETLTTEDGLPEGSITSILQDYLGYLWFGTQNGLARYDGYSMKVFQPIPYDVHGRGSHMVVAMYEDRDSILWVGSTTGLSRFDRGTDSFVSYTHREDDERTINSNKVMCVYEDRKGRLWIGTQAGLNLLDRKTGKFTRFSFALQGAVANIASARRHFNFSVNAIVEDPVTGDLLFGSEVLGLWQYSVDANLISKYQFATGKDYDVQIGRIQSFCKAKDGTIWMSSYGALTALNPNTRECRTYLELPFPHALYAPREPIIHGSALEDDAGFIWAIFYDEQESVYRVDPKTGSIRRFDPFEARERNTFETKILSLFEDHAGILWMGTWHFGVKKWDRRTEHFRTIRNGSVGPEGFVTTFSICYDPKGFLWSSTQKGLNRYDLRTGQYRAYLEREKRILDFPVIAALRDKDGTIWFGTWNSGLLQFDPTRESARFLFDSPGEVVKKTFVLMQDREGMIWIGTFGHGLYRYDTKAARLTHFVHDTKDPRSLSQNEVLVLYEDRDGTMWVGTNLGGLDKYNKRTQDFTHCGFHCVESVYEDKKGNFWVADYFAGLSLFDREQSAVIASFSQKDGLMTSAMWGISEDGNGNLWIPTGEGLFRFDPERKTIKRYTVADGLPDNYLKPSLGCKTLDGTMFLNSRKGVVAFHPDSIRENLIPPKIAITEVSLLRKRNGTLSFGKCISDLTEIRLAYDQNDLRIDYVGLHFREPAKNKYRYMLQKFDETWIDAGSERTARYTNLNPGRYVFRVTACNRDGIWNTQGTSLAIVIAPPWWRTWWAYILYAFALFVAGYCTWMLQLRRVRTKHALEMTKFEAQKLQEVDEMKTRFFTNVSHEFRTPLTLILGPVKQIGERVEDEKTKEDLGLVHRNARKLLTLVNQLLDISKIESGSMKLQTSPRNIIPILKALVVSFTPYAERKRIRLNFNTSEPEIIAYADKEKIESIVSNVLSNAFKFTPEAGQIDLSVYRDDNQVNIRVSDTGIGIPSDKLPRIFDRFYQVDNTHTRHQEGTGIGLALTKELVDLHKGTIAVESEEGKGTVVTVRIPLGKRHLELDEIQGNVGTEKDDSPTELEPVSSASWSTASLVTELDGGSDQPMVLLIEDNSDVRYYIRSILDGTCRLLESGEGTDGWNKANDHLPDIIVSDVMMPGMDGFELCRKLKTDERTSHIPVILLTAKATVQDKIEGFETGADAYLMKPFDSEELKARIKNLIEQRKRLHEHFKKHGIISFEDSKVLSIDKTFLQKVSRIIVDNISNTSFSVEMLAEMVAVSRSVLHRKITSLTGDPPVELIRRMRLMRAADLIEQKFGNLSEIALEVGFSNPSYFSECFKKQFGVPPSQYPAHSTGK